MLLKETRRFRACRQGRFGFGVIGETHAGAAGKKAVETVNTELELSLVCSIFSIDVVGTEPPPSLSKMMLSAFFRSAEDLCTIAVMLVILKGNR